MESLEKCIDNLEGYDNENLPYIKLSVYEAVSDLIFDQRKGLVATGISSERIMKILMEIYEKTGKLMVTQDKSIEKQNKILSNLDIYIDEIVDTYENAEVR